MTRLAIALAMGPMMACGGCGSSTTPAPTTASPCSATFSGTHQTALETSCYSAEYQLQLNKCVVTCPDSFCSCS